MYQRPSRLEITLQAPMPTLVQLSTVGRPLFQGNHKLHVMEVPYWQAGYSSHYSLAVLTSTSILPVHVTSSVYMYEYIVELHLPQY